MSTTVRRRRRRGGQALVEFMLVIPVMLALFVGVYTAAGFIANRQVAGQAARAGARVGAEIGGTAPVPLALCQGGVATNPCATDDVIIQQVKTIAKGVFDDPGPSYIDEIDIYQPCTVACSANDKLCSTNAIPGVYTTSLPRRDVYKWDLTYDADGTPHFKLQNPGAGNYTLDLRSQVHPKETVLGVRIVYTFKASVPLFTFFDRQTSEYATMCLAPLEAS